LTVCDPSDTIERTLHRMSKKGLVSMPVLSGTNIIGSVSVYDIMMYFLTGEKARKMNRPINKVLNCIAVSGGKSVKLQTHWIPYPLSEVLTLESLMDPFSSGMHRILVEVKSPDGITRRIRNISQTDVLRYLNEFQNLLPADILAANLHKLKAATMNVVTCKTTDKVTDAFKKIDRLYMSALAVIDPLTNELVSTLSASDLRFLNADTLSKLHEMSVKQFLTNGRKGKELRKPIVIDEYQQGMVHAIGRMLMSHTHRLWLVDDFKVPYGVISMSDLFRVLARRDRIDNPPRREDGTPYTSVNKLHKFNATQGNEQPAGPHVEGVNNNNKSANNGEQQLQQKQEYQQEHPLQGDQPKLVNSSS